jgi:RNA polymerase sigma factor (sigma-70 family)
MPKDSDMPPERFAEFLLWLNPDPEVAADIYIDIRDSIVRIFSWRHCADPEGMADEVFDRVCRKVPELKQTFEGDPRFFCYAVANNMVREYQKKTKLHVPIDDIDVICDAREELSEDGGELREDYLSECLQKLPKEKREMILDYYAKEKHAKIVHREQMARALGISVQALRVRVLRVRLTLEKCIDQRLSQAPDQNVKD